MKCVIVAETNFVAERYREAFGLSHWEARGAGAAINGRGYDHIVIVPMPDHGDMPEILQHWRTRLLAGGTIVVL